MTSGITIGRTPWCFFRVLLVVRIFPPRIPRHCSACGFFRCWYQFLKHSLLLAFELLSLPQHIPSTLSRSTPVSVPRNSFSFSSGFLHHFSYFFPYVVFCGFISINSVLEANSGLSPVSSLRNRARHAIKRHGAHFPIAFLTDPSQALRGDSWHCTTLRGNIIGNRWWKQYWTKLSTFPSFTVFIWGYRSSSSLNKKKIAEIHIKLYDVSNWSEGKHSSFYVWTYLSSTNLYEMLRRNFANATLS